MTDNGFYSYGSKALDGGDSGVKVLRRGGILGGTSPRRSLAGEAFDTARSILIKGAPRFQR